ncbi:XdhC family protein [Streptomyces corynorhini]|uniref:XdhC/CoxI family protein n=1 Tax=Streptomyces corynorhini TaxID=2282652 RepID=A0A370B8Y1_9ACTN|nr:XdhC/CoxI family protein [Streptomyces corynorhini]RDG36196.1 XdhC/CoxI family protein [Streptomyces corynorhini]
MLDIADELSRWLAQGRDVAVATVVAVSGSAPRLPGAALAVDGGGAVIGSVSGGCVEAAVYELCQQALRDGRAVLERFGYSDDDAFAAGLTCGGVIDVLVTPVRAGSPDGAVVAAALRAAVRGEVAALARVAEGPDALRGRALLVRPDGSYEGTLGAHRELDRTAAAEARALLDAGRTRTVVIGERGSRRGEPLTLLVESSTEPPRMIIFGAVDYAAALVGAGRFLGYHVTVCDARPVFTTRERFPGADEVVVDWPHRYLESARVDGRTVLCVLTHDARFDVPLLKLALGLPVGFVGAMGSRRTHLDRERRLREAGVPEDRLARLRSPIGLDLGARTPEETALSIAAEIVAARRGGGGGPLTGARTPIHHEAPAAGASGGVRRGDRHTRAPGHRSPGRL